MIQDPPATGSAELNSFLVDVKNAINTATKPLAGWKLSDFEAGVSEVISDKRDLIDIVTAWDDLVNIRSNFETEVARYEALYSDSKVLGNQYQEYADTFSQIMEWWDQNVRLIEDIEAFMIEVNADTSSAASYAQAAETSASQALGYRNQTESAITSATDTVRGEFTDLTTRSESAATRAETSETGAASAAENAAGSQVAAGEHSVAAALSASAAADSATAATEVADSVAGSESQAALSASAAASSASAAASSASDAEDAAVRAEAGATTVGDARDQAVTAKNAAVTAQTAAEAAVANAATVAEAKAIEEVDKLKAGAPDAFDTLLEIANELGDNETERAALTNSIAAKADADHVHTSEDITDAGVGLIAGQLVKREPDSSNVRVSESPIQPYHAASKLYVDGEIAKKANVGDIPTTDAGYNTYDASDPATDYPKGVSYSMNNGVSHGWNTAIQADTGYTNHSTFVMVQTLRNATYTRSTAQLVFTYDNEHKPVFMRKWYGEAWGPFRRLTDDGHTHTSEGITDARTWTGRSTDSDAIVKTDSGGWFYVGSNPTHGLHPANKQYVDQEVAGHILTNSQLPVTELIPGGANLNNYLTTGSYVQNVNVNAESGSNYPPNGIRAGLLEVMVGSTFVYQRYTEYTKGRVFSRAKYSSTWGAWAELLDASEATSVLGSGSYGKIVRREPGSDAIRAGNPAQTYHAANKQYVDARTPDVRVVSALPATPTAGVVYLVTG